MFYPNAIDVLKENKLLCKKFGFEGLSPFDNEINIEMDKKEKALLIKKSNIELLKESDVVIANLNNFRGFEPDSGTCFEIGYAEALGKTIYGYAKSADKSLIEHYAEFYNIEINAIDLNGFNFEDFNLPLNLMLSSNITIKRTLEDCLEDLKQQKEKSLARRFSKPISL